MFAIRLTTGETVFRQDTIPCVGEEFDEVLADVTEPPLGYRFDWTIHEAVEIGSDDPETARYESDLLEAVDEKRAAFSDPYLPRDQAKLIEYANKSMEARSNTPPWPYMALLAAERGTDVETVRLEILIAMDESAATLGAIAAAAQAGKNAIRAATTIPAKQAAFDAIVWPNPEGE